MEPLTKDELDIGRAYRRLMQRTISPSVAHMLDVGEVQIEAVEAHVHGVVCYHFGVEWEELDDIVSAHQWQTETAWREAMGL